MEYYLVFPKSNNQLLVRGEACDYLTFAKFDLKKNAWDNSDAFYWGDKILVSDFVDFEQISEEMANAWINKHK
ncbi:TPA: hypothetical protein R4338_001757 [Pasteurella multocida]|nr:hypothetical protein [Pasteurella multocida]HEA3265112.1 hypothetical protein [Pasteurella multocida]HED4406630.1 hypothetical protein [Pasteurella multocida]HED4416607.1 hypothetical protein [Pasteurella multocida]HED4449142.1 hypothetical protein [Pasteurella multocida]